MDANLKQLEEEVASLREKLEQERVYRLELEDERIFLLSENDRLQSIIDKSHCKSPMQNGKTSDKENLITQLNSSVDIVSNSKYACKNEIQIKDACGGKNVIAVAFCEIPFYYASGEGNIMNDTTRLILCGGVDATLSVYDATGALLHKWTLSAPILTIDVSKVTGNIACGMMDGSHAVICLGHHQPAVPLLTEHIIDLLKDAKLHAFSKHSKYVVQVAWSPDGQLLCTVSHDKTVVLYGRSANDEWEERRTIRCATTPECVAFLPAPVLTSEANESVPIEGVDKLDESATEEQEPTTMAEYFAQLALKQAKQDRAIHASATLSGQTTVTPIVPDEVFSMPELDRSPFDLVLGLRDVPYLSYINCGSFVTRQVSLNVNDWDAHVSFTPLSLSPSPTGDRLLVATDKNMHIIVRTGTNERLQVLSGHSCGPFGKPSAQWSPCGSVVYSNSDDENVIYVYDTNTGRVTARLEGHGRGVVRGLATCRRNGALLSGSYDKSVILWT